MRALPQFSTLTPFDHHPRTRLVFGINTLERLGELALELGAQKVLLVTDPGIAAAGHVERAASLLKEAGLRVQIFDRVIENPTTACVESISGGDAIRYKG